MNNPDEGHEKDNQPHEHSSAAEAKKSDKTHNYPGGDLQEEAKARWEETVMFFWNTPAYLSSEFHAMKLFDKATLILAAIGVTAAIHAGTVYMRQLSVMQDQLAEAQKQSFNQIRPWVSIVKDSFKLNKIGFQEFPAKPNDGLWGIHAELSYILKNYGSTPARKVFGGLSPYVSNDPLPHESWIKQGCDVGETAIRSGTGLGFFIPPNETQDTSITSDIGFSISIGQINQIWLVGCLVYLDSTKGDLHHTRFVYRSKPALTKPIMSIPGTSVTFRQMINFELWTSDVD